MKAQTVASPLVLAVENAWAHIQERHNDVPDVVVTLGSGIMAKGLKLGHFAPDAWAKGGEDARIHELFVGGEGLMLGAQHVMGTLLHEAAHAAAEARGIKDCSRNGRYHNSNFKAIAEELHIEVHHDKDLGWSTTTLPEDTADMYEGAIFELDMAITAYRAGAVISTGTTAGAQPTAQPIRKGGRASSNNGVSLTCNCGRRIRVSNTVAEMGGITCNLCGGEFA